MIKELLHNASQSTLGAAITATATSLTVADASSFPTSGNFRIIVESELMLVTAVSGTTFTVTRGLEGSTAVTHAGGASVTHIVTAGSLQAYGRQNNPWHESGRPAFALQDASGNSLTSANFTEFTATGGTGTPVVSDVNGTIVVKRPAGSSGAASSDGNCVLARTAPATPYTVTIGLQTNSVKAGLASLAGFRDGTGKSQFLWLPEFYSSTVEEAILYNASNEASYSGAVSLGQIKSDSIQWIKLADDGTNLTYSWSRDGVNWITLATNARTSFFASGPTQVIWGNDAFVTAYDAYTSLLHWFGA